MDANSLSGLTAIASTLQDPRAANAVHPLASIFAIAVMAVVAGANTFLEIADWGEHNLDWLADALDLPRGIPSHDTFDRVFGLLEAAEAEKFHRRYLARLAEHGQTQPPIEALPREDPFAPVSIDGKTCRGSLDHAAGLAAVHMISAWCTRDSMVLGQIATDAKSNEMTAIPELLKTLAIEGRVVTIDAGGCYRSIAETILERKADYLLQVKANQPKLQAAVKEAFEAQTPADRFVEPAARGHGRSETRCVETLHAADAGVDLEAWPGARSVVWVQASRSGDGKVSSAERLYVSSLGPEDAAGMLRAVRGHWGIENTLHWSLDVSFGNDSSRVRKANGDENLSRLKRLVLSLLKRAKAPKKRMSINRFRTACDRNPDLMARVLLGQG